MGELHLEILVDRMVREFSVQSNVGKPQVAYKETIRKATEAEGKYIRQTGGHGKRRRYGRSVGMKSDWKKAYVKVREGEKKIEFFEGM